MTAPPARGLIVRLLPAVVAAALVGYTLLATPLLDGMATLRSARSLTYAEARVQRAFAGIPVDDIQRQLDASLPRDSAVALSPPILADAFLRQRLAEGLYPRRVDQRSPYVLDVSTMPGVWAQVLARLGDSSLVVYGAPGAGVVTGSRHAPPSWWWLAALAASASAGGLGLLVLAVARIEVPRPVLVPSAALLAGAVAIGILTSIATWVELPFAGLPLGVAGLAAGVVAMRVRTRERTRSDARDVVRRPENWLLVGLLLAVFARLALLPVTLWDGRSVWLFRAHQVRQSGRFALADAVHGDYADWTHPSYPLLLPAWLAHATAFAGGWDERTASLGIAVLLAAVVSLDWALARARLGRWLGAALVFTLSGSVAYLTVGAYADGFLALLLLLEVLALAAPATERLGWLAAAAASLIKLEGLVLGAAAAIVCVIWFPHLRARGLAARLRPACVFLPALTHLVWARSRGVRLEYADVSWHAVLAEWPARLHLVLAHTWILLRVEGYTRCHAVLWAGLVGAGVGLVWGLATRLPDRMTRAALTLAGVCAVFALLALVASPFDPAWQAETAADRLLLGAATFGLLAGLTVVARAGRAA